MHFFSQRWKTLRLSKSLYLVEKAPLYQDYHLKIIANVVLVTASGDYQTVDMLSDRGKVIQEYILNTFTRLFLEEPVITLTETSLIIEGRTLWQRQ